MKTFAHVGGIYKHEIGESAFTEFLRVYPEGKTGSQGHSFRAALPVDDPRLTQIFDLTRALGLRRWDETIPASEWRTGKYYNLALDRRYNALDYRQFDLFELRLPSVTCLFKVRRGPSGLLEIPLPPWPEEVNALSSDFLWGDGTTYHFYFVAKQISDALSAADLAHFTLSPTTRFEAYPPADENSAEGGDPAGLSGPFWEVNSDLVMPPVSPTMELADRDGRRLWPGRATRIYRKEGIYSWPELHYRASDLRAIGPFDIARTFENFGWGGEERMPDQSPVIVSKRFYDVCQKHGFKMDWLPVHVDPI